MKQIVYLAVDNGVDGRDAESIRFASLDEAERDKWIESSPNKPWLSPVDRVGNLEAIAAETWKQLDGLKRLALTRKGTFSKDEWDAITTAMEWQISALNRRGEELGYLPPNMVDEIKWHQELLAKINAVKRQ